MPEPGLGFAHIKNIVIIRSGLMKKSVKVLASVLGAITLIGSAQAATPGAYAGLNLGASQLDGQSDTRGFAGGVFGGYNFNKFIGLEGGFNHYATYENSASNAIASATATLQYDTFNLVGKVYLPISDSGFNLYALGGIAIVNQDIDVELNTVFGSASDSNNITRVRPMYGLGASYDIPSTKFTAKLEASRVQSSNEIARGDMLTFGLAYNIN